MTSVRYGVLAGLVAALAMVTFEGIPLAAPGLAVSSITGTVSHGATVRLNGNGFGTKPTAAPLKFDNFEAGTVGQELGNGWDMVHSDPGYNPIYSTRRLRTNSGRSAEARFINDGYLSSFGINRGSTPFDKIYFDAWYYLDATAPYMRNTKPIRIHTNEEGQPNLYMAMWCSAYTDSVVDQDGVGSSSATTTWSGLATSYYAGNWRHIQGWVEQSSPNTADGTVQISVDGVPQFDRVRAILNRTSSSTYWNTIWFGNYLGHDTNPGQGSCGAYGDAWTLWDDVYVDTTRARVEIGDASTYASSRHREIQVPSAWSNSTISVTLNRGTFNSFNGLYLYVIDTEGNVSAGYPLSGAGGGGGGPTLPATPTGVHIVGGN